MADRKQKSEFLGGGPKFNAVGRDTRGPEGVEEPVIRINQTGHWLRIAAAIVAVLFLAALLFYLNEQNIGRTQMAPTHAGHSVSSDEAKPATDPNLK